MTLQWNVISHCLIWYPEYSMPSYSIYVISFSGLRTYYGHTTLFKRTDFMSSISVITNKYKRMPDVVLQVVPLVQLFFSIVLLPHRMHAFVSFMIYDIINPSRPEQYCPKFPRRHMSLRFPQQKSLYFFTYISLPFILILRFHWKQCNAASLNGP